MEKKLIFNADGTDQVSERRIIGGNSTNLFNLNEVKYGWAKSLYRVMIGNFWVPEKVDLTQDGRDYKKLTEAETKAFDGIISFLTFLDSIQTNNIPHVADYITAPEVKSLLSIQEFQEVIHSQSYAYILESVIPSSKRGKVYELWRSDKNLLTRNKYIAGIYQNFIDEPSKENFAKVLVANYVLEGIYFYNGFIFFYNLCSRNLLLSVGDEIKYIQRDEESHVDLFANMIKEVMNENPGFIEESMVHDIFSKGVEQEIEWTNHIIGDSILGINKESTEKYTKYLANKRLEKLGFSKLYEGYTENPYKHLDKMFDGTGSGVKANFFESTVSSYNQSSSVVGWEEI